MSLYFFSLSTIYYLLLASLRYCRAIDHRPLAPATERKNQKIRVKNFQNKLASCISNRFSKLIRSFARQSVASSTVAAVYARQKLHQKTFHPTMRNQLLNLANSLGALRCLIRRSSLQRCWVSTDLGLISSKTSFSTSATSPNINTASVDINKDVNTLNQSKASFLASESSSESAQPYPTPQPNTQQPAKRKLTIHDIQLRYAQKQPLTMITAHDYITGKFANDSLAEMVLVGDSLAMVSLGHPSTNQLEFDEFKYAAKAVSRAVTEKYLISDMPYGTYETSPTNAINNAISLFRACPNLQAVKMEGGAEYASLFRQFHKVGISVVGHVGLTPQRYNFLGGFKLQGAKRVADGLQIFEDCLKLQNEGKVKMIVIECVPLAVAKIIAENLQVPTIGIGAGKHTSGQVLVMADMLGMLGSENGQNKPKFVKQYEGFYDKAVEAINEYDADVKNPKGFPGPQQSYKMPKDVYQEFELHVKQLVKRG